MNQELLKLGIKEEEIGSWCSDLHVLKNEISTKFIDEYRYKQNVTTFRSQIDGLIWYDIPFAYVEYYSKRHKAKMNQKSE